MLHGMDDQVVRDLVAMGKFLGSIDGVGVKKAGGPRAPIPAGPPPRVAQARSPEAIDVRPAARTEPQACEQVRSAVVVSTVRLDVAHATNERLVFGTRPLGARQHEPGQSTHQVNLPPR